MDGPHWLDEREARAWRGFIAMGGQLTARLNRHLLRDSGLSGGDYAVLVSLSEATDGRLRAFELGRALDWEKSRLSHHLTRMEGRGLISRADCDTDARGAFVVITAKGRSGIEAAAPQHVEDVRRLFVDVLTPDQLDALAAIAETVLAHLAAGSDEAELCGNGGPEDVERTA